MTPIEKAINKASELLAKREDENEYHLHDVDRKWIIEAMMDYAEHCLNGKSLQTEISDKEIEKARYEAFLRIDEKGDIWAMGAKWYREQLKNKI